jgi:hypothetical protein
MSQVVYFLSDADGRWELSHGDRKLGHIEQAGLGFVVHSTSDSVLAHLNGFSFASKQEALATIESYMQASDRHVTFTASPS